MKRTLILAVVLAATITAFAQGTSPKAPQNAPTPNPNSAQPGKVLPQAKTQEEYKAFQEAMTTIQQGGPAQGEAAANAFVDKFKNSEIISVLYHRVLQAYQKDNNTEKATEIGRKILAISPNDPIANVLVATMISERVAETDLDMEERLAEAEKDAKKSLETLDTDFLANPGTPQERIDASKNMIRSMAYAALANAETTRTNYQAAENYFKQATSIPGVEVDAVTWLRYSLLLDKEKKYAEAMGIANKALDASPVGSPTRDLVTKERERLTMLLSSSTPTPVSPTPAAAPKQ